MRTKSSVVAYVLAGLSLSLLLIGSTMATNPDAGPAAKTKTLSIPASAFNEVRWGDDWNTHRTGELLTLLGGASNTDIGNYYVPLILPDKTKIYGIRLISKNDDFPSINLQLIRSTTSGAQNVDTQILSTSNPAFSSTTYVTHSLFLRSPYVVNNNGASYSLHLYLPDSEGNSVAVHHVEIVYSGKW